MSDEPKITTCYACQTPHANYTACPSGEDDTDAGIRPGTWR